MNRLPFDLGLWLVSFVWVGSICLLGFFLAVVVTKRMLNHHPDAKKGQIFRTGEVFYAEPAAERNRALRSLLLRMVFFATLIERGLIGFHDFHLFKTIAVAVTVYLWTEVWFYLAHRLLHTKPLYWIHRPHHAGQVTRPIAGAAFGMLETLIILGGNAIPLVFFSLYLPWLSLPFLAVFLFFKDLNNFLDHMNIDLYNKDYMSSWKSIIFNSPTYHALHHARHKGNYAQSSPWLDRLFGTMYEDTSWAFARVKEGRGLLKINERKPRSSSQADD
jgi:sterol desaturase/sphingolipid hydroxylase (fatty acid hydroxylase superfamily)